ncbi:MAG: hypothetical protein DCF15_19025 [Phormidesmis priestleyi]|uniref:DNA-binding response regulator n=1 Tax=Phormidesmis priestleyi TaxID=268141 RepID=A0A2W4WSE1_9CYAN|nr:MAG: hypothetical protein DCF15_19025 [Phormidesmis priestleyi]
MSVTVLVVEDGPSKLALMSHYLRSEGFGVIEARRSFEGSEGTSAAVFAGFDIDTDGLPLDENS